jgi:hypothetical protein
MADTLRPGSADGCIVSCGIRYQGLSHLVETGFLNPRRLLFTPLGLHALPDRLEKTFSEAQRRPGSLAPTTRPSTSVEATEKYVAMSH